MQEKDRIEQGREREQERERKQKQNAEIYRKKIDKETYWKKEYVRMKENESEREREREIMRKKTQERVEKE
jgi:hypothetical protein